MANIRIALLSLAIVVSGSFSAVSATPVPAQLEDSLPQCASLVKQCFAHAGLERANCFYSSASHPFCEGSALGSLVMQRWEMAPNRPAGAEQAPGFLGPHLVDQECLRTFDNKLSGKLIEGAMASATVEQMSESLEKCYETMSIELVRP